KDDLYVASYWWIRANARGTLQQGQGLSITHVDNSALVYAFPGRSVLRLVPHRMGSRELLQLDESDVPRAQGQTGQQRNAPARDGLSRIEHRRDAYLRCEQALD